MVLRALLAGGGRAFIGGLGQILLVRAGRGHGGAGTHCVHVTRYMHAHLQRSHVAGRRLTASGLLTPCCHQPFSSSPGKANPEENSTLQGVIRKDSVARGDENDKGEVDKDDKGDRDDRNAEGHKGEEDDVFMPEGTNKDDQGLHPQWRSLEGRLLGRRTVRVRPDGKRGRSSRAPSAWDAEHV
jgi:hypothetical protein